jgi:hypothetical protein
MTKEELVKYCKSIGLVECNKPTPKTFSPFTEAFRFPSELTNKLDFIAAYDDCSNQVILADKCFVNETDIMCPIRMLGQITTSNLSDEAIMDRIDELTKDVTENILFIKYRNMKTRISKLNGDFN